MTKIFFRKGMMRVLLLIAGLACSATLSYAQNNKPKNTVPPPLVQDTGKVNLSVPIMMKDSANGPAEFFTLKQCIDYAMLHQPALNKSNINISITKTTNDIALAGWLP